MSRPSLYFSPTFAQVMMTTMASCALTCSGTKPKRSDGFIVWEMVDSGSGASRPTSRVLKPALPYLQAGTDPPMDRNLALELQRLTSSSNV